MSPILSNTFPVVGNGLGGLPDAIECVVSHEINGIYELQMRYPVTGQHFDEIEIGRFIMAKPDDLTDAQPFRVYRITKPLNGVVTVYARHICYDMQGIVVEPFSAGSLTEAFQTIPTVLTPANSFNFQTTRSVASGIEITEPRPLWKLLGGQEGSILDVYGGEWDFDGYDVKLVTQLGTNRGVTIRYGKNMTDLEQDATIEAAYSGVYPFWYDEETETLVTLTEKFVTVPGAVVTNRVLTLDCSDDFDTQPTEQQLRDRANAYISANSIGNAKTSWKVSFVSSTGYEDDLRLLEQVQLGDTLGVHYDRMGVDATARAVKTEYDVLAGRYKAVTIGRVKQSLAQIIVDQQERTESQFAGVKSDIEHAVDGATDFIKHGEGYMRFIYNASDELTEIVSLDDPDITQAQSVWRWNNGGFGHSSTGYNGPYTLAITQNGAIVADFITAGTLNANVIRAGILQDTQGYNSWNLQTGAFTITNGSINISTSSETQDIIRLLYTWQEGASAGDKAVVMLSPSGLMVQRVEAGEQEISSGRHVNINDNMVVVGYNAYQDGTAWYHSPITVLQQNNLRFTRFDNSTTPPTSSPWLELASNNITLYDASGTRRELLMGGSGSFHMYDSSGVLRHQLDGGGRLWQYDGNGKKRTYLEYGDIMLYTSAEKQTAKLSGSNFGTGGSLQLYDTSANERTQLTVDGLKFFNASGAEQTKIRDSGDSSWNTGRYYASLISKVQPADMNRYHPVVSVKGYSSDWAIGTLSNHLYFVNTTDSAYDNGRNHYLKYELEYADTSGGAQSYSILTTKNTNDYVIAEGTYGGWQYRRWKSRFFECWYTIAPESRSFSAWGNAYYSPEIGVISYPTTFASVPYEYVSPTPGSAWVYLAGGDTAQTTSKSGGYRGLRPVSGAATFGIKIYVAGISASDG